MKNQESIELHLSRVRQFLEKYVPGAASIENTTEAFPDGTFKLTIEVTMKEPRVYEVGAHGNWIPFTPKP
jgi:hypothetical protein